MPSIWTGPWVSSRTRLAMRNASTTPWQYPRGVILRTSIALRVYVRWSAPPWPLRRSVCLADPREQIVFRERSARLAPGQLVVLGAEGELVDLTRHRREPGVWVVLAHVGAERVTLAVDILVHVDAGGDELIGRARDPHVAAHRALGVLRHLLHEGLHHRARNRGVVQLSHRRSVTLDDIERGIRHEVSLDVIGVSVNAVLRIRDDDVRALLADEYRELRRRVLELGLMERAWVLVVRAVDHSRVSIAEELQPVDFEDFRRGFQLLGPDLAQARPGRRLVHVVDLAHLAARGRDEDDAMAVRLRFQHHPARRDCLVVRMRVHEQQGCHLRKE